MPTEPFEIMALLRGARCETLDAYQQQLLAARCGAGATIIEVADAWGYSRQTIDREFHRICDIVLGQFGLPCDPALMAQWFSLHLDTDLSIAVELIRKRRVFAEPPSERPRRTRRTG